MLGQSVLGAASAQPAVKQRPITLTVAPKAAAGIGDAVTLTANLRRGLTGAVVFYDGGRILGIRLRLRSGKDPAFTTTELVEGQHALSAALLVGGWHGLKVQRSPVVPYRIGPVRAADRSSIDVVIPKVRATRKPPAVLGIHEHRPPEASGIHGRLAFTGADIVRLVMLAVALLLVGLAARWSGAARRCRLVWAAAAALILTGGGWAVADHTGGPGGPPDAAALGGDAPRGVTAAASAAPSPSAAASGAPDGVAQGWTPWAGAGAGVGSATVAASVDGRPIDGGAAVAPGSAVRLQATGFASGERVVVSPPGGAGGRDAPARADAHGTVVFTFTVPSGLPAGTYTVLLRGVAVTGAFGLTVRT